MVFNVFGSRDLPRDPQETQEPPKKHPKSSKGPKKKHQKNQDKCLRGKKCLKPAISFLTISEPNFPSQNCTFLKHILNMAFDASPKKNIQVMLEHIVASEQPKRAKMNPKETS